MVKKVERWQSTDDQLWETEEAAQRHEKRYELENEFPTIYGDTEGCKIYFDDFKDWLKNDGGEEWLRKYMWEANLNEK